MTIEEAIKEIELANANITKINTKEQDEAYRIAIESLKKQIQKKPNRLEKYFDKYMCPECGEAINSILSKDYYCRKCGQKIDWNN